MVIELLYPGAHKLDRGVYVVSQPLRGPACAVGPWVLLTWGLFARLTPAELRAIVAHERGHRWHLLPRGLVARVCPWWLRAMVRRQEFSADDHAKRQGHARDLATALQKLDPADRGAGKIYPPTSERVKRLLA